MKLVVIDKIGARCIIADDGQKIYDDIIDLLKKGESVTLDFKDVNQFASPFFNFAIGQLLKHIKENDIRKLLHCENLNDTGKLVFERVIENAAKYHNSTDYKQIVDDMLEQQSKESD